MESEHGRDEDESKVTESMEKSVDAVLNKGFTKKKKKKSNYSLVVLNQQVLYT